MENARAKPPRPAFDRRLVHFIASDGHDLKHRPPTMNEAYAWLVKNYGQSMADALCIDNPRATLNGNAVSLPYMDAEIPQKKWYQIWR